jgi:hypothetical protein
MPRIIGFRNPIIVLDKPPRDARVRNARAPKLPRAPRAPHRRPTTPDPTTFEHSHPNRAAIHAWAQRRQMVIDLYQTARETIARQLASVAPRTRGAPAVRRMLRLELGHAREARDEALDALDAERRAAFRSEREIRSERAARKNPKRQEAARRRFQQAWERLEQSCRAEVPREYVKPCIGSGLKLQFAAQRQRRSAGEMFLEGLEREAGVEAYETRHGVRAARFSGSDFERSYQDAEIARGEALLEDVEAEQAYYEAEQRRRRRRGRAA